MRKKSWLTVSLIIMLSSFYCLAKGEVKSFFQPCPDASGYYGWLKLVKGETHLGHDYNAPADTHVRAITDGIICLSLENVKGFGSTDPRTKQYISGGLIWVKHRLSNGKYFYALYGHIKPIKKSGDVKANEVIGTIIPFYLSNTSYAPHLHFGIWNSEKPPPKEQLGYGAVGNFVDPKKFLDENKPFSNEREKQKNELKSGLERWEKLIKQTRFEDISKKVNVIVKSWRVITDKATGAKLDDEYRKLYALANNYLNKAIDSISKTRYSLERGELDQAENYLRDAQKNHKIAQDTYKIAIEVWQGHLEAGEILAKGLQRASDVALSGLASLVPGAQQLVYKFLLVRDFIVDSSLEGFDQASKEAIVKIAIT